MKKILSISGIVAAVMLLAGCGMENVPAENPQKPTFQIPSSSPSSPSKTQVPADASTPNNSAVDFPATPAKTGDVDESLDQLNKDLNSADAAAPDPNELNSADLQK